MNALIKWDNSFMKVYNHIWWHENGNKICSGRKTLPRHIKCISYETVSIGQERRNLGTYIRVISDH